MIMGLGEQRIPSILTIHDCVDYDVLSCSTLFLFNDASENELFRMIQVQIYKITE